MLIGLAGSMAVALYAWRRESLAMSGAAAAVIVGTVLFGAGSPAWFGTLLVFFFTSSALSKGKKQLKQSEESGYEKGSRRDAGQVMANGGLGAALCLLWALWPGEAWWYAFVGVMAAVTADTWATEVGALSRREPVTVIGFRRVPRGTSGAVSPLGTLAAACGALVIGLAAWAFAAMERAILPVLEGWGWIGTTGLLSDFAESVTANWAATGGGFALVPAALVGGVAGAFADSLIGATLQRMNRCTVCGRLVEQAAHCGRPAERVRGLRWMNNDAVNLISSALGGLAALLAGWLLG
jgi:uncharacterized protein (TIGR00297 family)